MKKIIFLLYSTWIIPTEIIKNTTLDHYDLLIKMPTRQRAARFTKLLDTYYALLSGEYTCCFLISCDENDTSMNNDTIKDFLLSHNNIIVAYGVSKSKIDACNRDMEYAPSFNVLLLTSDDMVPIKYGYDKKIMQLFHEKDPNYTCALKLRDHERNDSILNTLPILGKNYYYSFGYIYHPDYLSFYCDLELTIVSKILEKEIVSSEVLIRHENPALNPENTDELYLTNLKFLDTDKKMFLDRYAIRFDLDNISAARFKWVENLIKEHF